MRPRLGHLAAHLLRLAAAAVALPLLPPAGRVPLAAACFLGAFCLAHDLAHGALRLPRRLNELALSLAGLAMLTSGHAMRVAHLHHYAAPLAADDHEGAAAHGPFGRAVWRAPWLAFLVRRDAFRRAPRRERRWQLAEHGASLVLALVVGPSYAATAVVLQLLAPVWAGRIPHTAPPRVLRLARSLAWTRSVVVLSLAFHDAHHARPKVPTLALAASDAPTGA